MFSSLLKGKCYTMLVNEASTASEAVAGDSSPDLVAGQGLQEVDQQQAQAPSEIPVEP